MRRGCERSYGVSRLRGLAVPAPNMNPNAARPRNRKTARPLEHSPLHSRESFPSRALLPPRFFAGGEGADRRMRGAHTRYARSTDAGPRPLEGVTCTLPFCAYANYVSVKRPLIRLRHLLPRKKPRGRRALDLRLPVILRRVGSANAARPRNRETARPLPHA